MLVYYVQRGFADGWASPLSVNYNSHSSGKMYFLLRWSSEKMYFLFQYSSKKMYNYPLRNLRAVV